ncbi:MAG: PQQ-binding-like beta-propeller repeat protein [Rhodospirillaceae bacterium]
MMRFARVFSLVLVTAALAGCSTVGDMFSKDSNEVLPGTRISVLALERELRPSIETTDTRIILPTPQDTTSWPGAGGFSHHAMHHMVISDVPRRSWSTGIGEGTGLRNHMFAEPIIANGHIYTMDADGRVTSFDAKTGKRQWRADTAPRMERDNKFLGGAIAIEGDRIFATSGAAEVMAMSAVDGKILWRATTETPVRAAPAVNGGRVFITTIENQVIAFAANDGAQLWTYAGASTPTILLGGSAPAVDGGVVVAALSTGELAALRVDNGALLWSETVVAIRRTEAAASLPDIAARPVIDRGRVYAVGQSGLIVAIDLRTGNRLWEAPVAGIYQPWVAGDFLYTVTIDAEAVCIDARSGRILWVTQLRAWEDENDREDRVIWAGPVLASDRLILVNSLSEAISISPYSGEVMGTMDLPASATMAPVFADSTMFLLDDDGDLTAYR